MFTVFGMKKSRNGKWSCQSNYFLESCPELNSVLNSSLATIHWVVSYLNLDSFLFLPFKIEINSFPFLASNITIQKNRDIHCLFIWSTFKFRIFCGTFNANPKLTPSFMNYVAKWGHYYEKKKNVIILLGKQFIIVDKV